MGETFPSLRSVVASCPASVVSSRFAFQQVEELPASTWPGAEVPQQLHLDFSVPTTAELATQHERALSLGAPVLEDRSTDPDEPLYVYADPTGHPFCILVVPTRRAVRAALSTPRRRHGSGHAARATGTPLEAPTAG